MNTLPHLHITPRPTAKPKQPSRKQRIYARKPTVRARMPGKQSCSGATHPPKEWTTAKHSA